MHSKRIQIQVFCPHMGMLIWIPVRRSGRSFAVEEDIVLWHDCLDFHVGLCNLHTLTLNFVASSNHKHKMTILKRHKVCKVCRGEVDRPNQRCPQAGVT
jgi:hypothetical protein